MDKVAELLATIPFEKNNTKVSIARDELIRDNLRVGEIIPDDILNYNAGDYLTKLLFCTTCDNISEVTKPTPYDNHVVCYECECFI